MVKQTIFYPFMLFRQFARGVALDELTHSPLYTTRQFGNRPLLDASAAYTAEDGRGTVFLVNRSQTDSLPTEIIWQNGAPKQIVAVHQFAGADPKAANTFTQPEVIIPKKAARALVVDGVIRLKLPPLSFTVVEGEWAAEAH